MEEQSSRTDAQQLDVEGASPTAPGVRADSSEGVSPESPLSSDSLASDSSAETPPESGDAATAPEATADSPLDSDAVAGGDEPAAAADEQDADEQEKPAAPIRMSRGKGRPIELDEGEEEVEREPHQWYIIKVQTNREASVRRALIRRIKMMGLEDFFGDIVVPEEKVTEVRAGKKRVVKRKLFPGYVMVNMSLSDDAWHLVRGTSGVGDFTGSGGKPSPMPQHEIDRIIVTEEESQGESPKLQIAFQPGDRVKINEGTFDSFEGEVESIDESNGRVTVIITIFGRSTPVELEYWQVESL